MIWLISGSREFPDEALARDIFEHCFQPGDTVVHGGAKGVDSWADSEAKSAGCTIEVYHPSWEAFGKAAGPMRNGDMLRALLDYKIQGKEVCAIVCWDGSSKGTKQMLGLVEQHGVRHILLKEVG
jgi:hypothetical protein